MGEREREGERGIHRFRAREKLVCARALRERGGGGGRGGGAGEGKGYTHIAREIMVSKRRMII